jgi:hypothetical protein
VDSFLMYAISYPWIKPRIADDLSTDELISLLFLHQR